MIPNIEMNMAVILVTNGNSATAYYTEDGDYVVVDDVTNEVIQISAIGDSNWIPDSAIEDPYSPK